MFRKTAAGYRYVLIAVQALVIALAALFSITGKATLLVSTNSLVLLFAACMLGYSLPPTLETIKWLCLSLGLAGMLTSIVALAGAACSKLGLDLFAFAIRHRNYMYGLPQVESYFGNPNTFGLFLVFCIAGVIILFTLYQPQREKNKLIALSFYIVLAIELSAFTLTFSRAAFAALFLFATCFIWLNSRRLCYTPLVLLSAAVLTSRQAFAKDSVIEMLSALFSGRIQLWAEGIKLFTQHPLFGTGLGGWFAITGNNLSPHNTYLHIAIEIGSVGLILYILYTALFLQDLRGAMKRAIIQKSRYAILSGLYSLCLGLLAHQLFESYLYQGLPLFLYAIIPLHALIREPAKVLYLREIKQIQLEGFQFYRKAS